MMSLPVCALLACLLTLTLSPLAAGEEVSSGAVPWLSGYASTVEGEPFDYHSPLPDTRQALLVRCNREYPSVTWDTAPLPADYSFDTVRFVWLFALDANSEVHEFTLFVNGKASVRFQNPRRAALGEAVTAGEAGAFLRLRTIEVDRYDDAMGFALLDLPATSLEKGKPVRLKVAGDGSGSAVWYMTYPRVLAPEAVVEPVPAVFRDKEKTFQRVFLTFIHLEEKGEVAVRVENGAPQSHPLRFGLNRIPLAFPCVDAPEEVHLRIEPAGGASLEKDFILQPVRPWTVYFVQHTHTDIGYTRPQTEILPEHLRFIDYALDYCDLTDSLPEDAKFRWTCEASWAVREYLKSRPAAQIERLKRRVAEGRIEVTGMLFNLSEIPDEPSLAALLEPLRAFQEAGLPVATAMQNDVNGIAWCLADYFPPLGVRYLVMGQHSHRARACFKRPTAFWWESPSGSRMLGFRPDHYMTGNFLGVHTGRMEGFEPALFRYLDELAGKGYPFDEIEIQYSGYFTDNSPPSLASCELIRQWNETYAWPKLKSATIRQFMDRMAERHGDGLEAYRAAWPDWWTDGFGSAARETAAARRTHADLIASTGLLALGAWMGGALPSSLPERTQAVYESLLFYDEHTFGAAESITDPFCENSLVQWGEKTSYVWDAVMRTRLLREEALGILQPRIARAEVPTIAVFNTLGFPRSGLVTFYADHEILPKDRRFSIQDAEGRCAAAQLLSSRSDGSYWALWAEDVPALGFKTYRIEVEEGTAPPAAELGGALLENRFYRLEIDAEKGTVRSFFDKELGLELAERGAEWDLGAFLYERLSDRRQLELYKVEGCERTSLKDVRVRPGVGGAIWESRILAGASEGCVGPEGVSLEIRLFKPVKRVDLLFTIRKKEILDPEGIYVAFPFDLPGARIFYEAQGGEVEPGVNQMPGSASDWQTVQSYACARSDAAQIVLGCGEIPLMQIGGINLGRFAYTAKPEKPRFFSWVMNNYWTTNFRAGQEGEFTWSYYLTSTRDPSPAAAARFGWGGRVPLVARVLPAGEDRSGKSAFSLFHADTPHLLLMAARPAQDGEGVLFQWREVDGVETEIDLPALFGDQCGVSFKECNALGEPLRDVKGRLSFRPLEVKFVEAVAPDKD